MTASSDTPRSDPQEAVEVLLRGAPVIVGEREALRSAAGALTRARVGAALVRRGDGREGIVSERDLTRALADGADPDARHAGDVASFALVCVDARDRILQVAFEMLDKDIRHVVVRRDDEIIGIISSRAVFTVLAEHALRAY
jgi:CBS domain-containing protein